MPDVLAGVAEPDPSPTPDGPEGGAAVGALAHRAPAGVPLAGANAVARAAERFGVWCGISLATVSIEEIAADLTPSCSSSMSTRTKRLNTSMIERCKAAKFDAIALTVDTIVGGKRERCLRSGFSFAATLHRRQPAWLCDEAALGLDYLLREKFALPQLDGRNCAREGTGKAISVRGYFTEIDQTLDWDRAAKSARTGADIRAQGVMSAGDARRAVEIGADAIMVSGGGRQLDGSRAFDARPKSSMRSAAKSRSSATAGCGRGTHAEGPQRRGNGSQRRRLYLYALAAAGENGVERALTILHEENHPHDEADGRHPARPAGARPAALSLNKNYPADGVKTSAGQLGDFSVVLGPSGSHFCAAIFSSSAFSTLALMSAGMSGIGGNFGAGL